MAIGNKQIGIYKIISPSCKIYIGQSWNIENRFSKYKSLSSVKKQRILYNSLLKYGWENHTFEIIEHCLDNITQKELDDLEIYYIKFYKDSGHILLNIKEGGLGGKHHTESIEKMLNTRGKWNHTEESKKLISDKHKGMKHSSETIAKMKGRKFSKEHIDKLKNRKRSDLTIEKFKKLILPGKLVLNIESGIFYDSIVLAAKTFNINQKTLHNRLTGISKNKTNLILV
jgi:group I intron endonuclease